MEHKTDGVLPIRKFLVRLARYAMFAFLLMGFSVGIGVFGYKFLADLSWIDSFHMACMILTGMGPVAVMTTSYAKIFSSFYALYSGVAFLSVTAVFLAPVIHRILHILHVEE